MSEHIGPWLLIERLARGGMAEVWRGRHESGGPDVCIKRLSPSLTSDPDFVEMFRDEARLVLQLHHPGVVCTHSLFDDNPGATPQELCLILELVNGPSLARLTRLHARAEREKGPLVRLSVREALTIASQTARALGYVHGVTDEDDGGALRIVHRDVSPSNLLLDPSVDGGRVVLIDFGVARAASRLTHTRAGLLKGKAAYMAPEQVRQKNLDGRVDQFALGVVLWELLCERPLFAAHSELRVLELVERAEVVRPSLVLGDRLDADGVDSVDVDVKRALDALVLRALAADRDDRFASCDAFADAIDVVLAGCGGPVDLVPLIHRGQAALESTGNPAEQPTRARTRVIVTNPDAVVDADVPRRAPRAASAWPLVAGGAVVAAIVGGAAMVALGGGDGEVIVDVEAVVDAGVVVDVDRVAALEAKLNALPSHPCRTELLDEVVDRAGLAGLEAGIAVDVDACAAAAAAAPALRAALERQRLLTPPPPPRPKRKRGTVSEAQTQAWLDETSRRGRAALDAGATDAARALLLAVVGKDPGRVDDRRALAEAYRRLGDTALAAVELRAYLAAHNDAPDRARLERWFRRNNLPR